MSEYTVICYGFIVFSNGYLVANPRIQSLSISVTTQYILTYEKKYRHLLREPVIKIITRMAV